MGLTRAQFARAAALEDSQLRMMRLCRMSSAELHALFAGDPGEAAIWVASAAECGVVAAQLRLGRMLLTGTGVTADERAAFRWFERAAGRGDAEAMNMLGRCHENGWGAPINLTLAAAYYRSSADGGHDWGQYNLGNLLFDGRGVRRDRAQALCWYLRAAAQGHAWAMNLIGRCLEEGWGCQRSPTDGAYWYRRSAEAGYFRGQFNYALVLMEQGRCALAAHWFEKAAAAGNEATCSAIARVLEDATDPDLVQIRIKVAKARD